MAEAKQPWDIKANQSDPKPSYAAQSPKDSERPEVQEPWNIQENLKDPKPKYAAESPKDHEKPEAVKWPPTRRALMASTLSDS